MSMLDTQLAELRKQLEATPWLKWALGLATLLLAAFIWQGLETLRLRAQDAAMDEEVKLHRVRGLQGQDAWIERAQQASQLHQALLAEIPTVTTAGLAQATLQSWLRDVASSVSDDQSLRVTVDSPAVLDQPAGVLRVHATLSGALSPRQTLTVLRRIESSTQLILIETLEIRSDAARSASIGLNAYYRLADAQTATEASE